MHVRTMVGLTVGFTAGFVAGAMAGPAALERLRGYGEAFAVNSGLDETGRHLWERADGIARDSTDLANAAVDVAADSVERGIRGTRATLDDDLGS